MDEQKFLKQLAEEGYTNYKVTFENGAIMKIAVKKGKGEFIKIYRVMDCENVIKKEEIGSIAYWKENSLCNILAFLQKKEFDIKNVEVLKMA